MEHQLKLLHNALHTDASLVNVILSLQDHDAQQILDYMQAVRTELKLE